MPVRDPAEGELRIRLDLRYDGTDFHGWAQQAGQRSVQQELQEGLFRITRVPARLTVAGRTDAGVHARGQVAHLDLPEAVWAGIPRRASDPPGVSLVRRLAGVLPMDLTVTAATPAAPGFDARFSALSRRYSYRIADDVRLRDPLRRRDVLFTRQPLDLAAMNQALEVLLGEHDFLPFCRPRLGASTVRTMLALRWDRDEHGLAALTITADAFCHHMVRAIVGVSLAVGEGRRGVGWPAELLTGRERSSAVPVVAAHGLTLEEVAYPPDHELAEQRERARRYRGADPQPWHTRSQQL